MGTPKMPKQTDTHNSNKTTVYLYFLTKSDFMSSTFSSQSWQIIDVFLYKHLKNFEYQINEQKAVTLQ